MPRSSGIYSLPPGSVFTANTLAQSSVVNAINADIAADLNTIRPIVAGGTGGSDQVSAAAALAVLPLSGNGLIAMNGGPLESFRNQLINGNFDVWQRAITQSGVGYGSDDRWRNDNTGTTKTHSLQTFASGQTAVPGNPVNFSRTVVTSVAGASNNCVKLQKIENVYTLAGQTATLTFYAKADASKNIAVEFIQSFGTGGSPSADVNAIGVTTIALTTGWTRFNVLVTLPSISGKTLGSNGDSCLFVQFWFDAGSSYNSRTNSLGQQSGTFDISHVSLVQGDARSETDPFSPRHFQQEVALCQRYYQTVNISVQSPATTGSIIVPWYCSTLMRTTPALTLVSAGTVVNGSVTGDTAADNRSGRLQFNATVAGGNVIARIDGLDSEL